MSHKEVMAWYSSTVDPCLLSGKNRPEIEFCSMHTFKHASGVYNACETAKLRLYPDKNHSFSLHINTYIRVPQRIRDKEIIHISYLCTIYIVAFLGPNIDFGVHRVICKP